MKPSFVAGTLLACAGLLLLAACGSAPTPVATPPTPSPTAPPATPAPAATSTPMPTATPIPTRTPAPAATPTPTSSPTPTAAAPVVDCPVLPAGGFLTVWQSDPELQGSLGCPTSLHPRVTPTAWEVTTSYQTFEGGAMLWSDAMGWYAQPVVYALYAGATFQRFPDAFDPAVDPSSGGEAPPGGLVEPIDRFGKVWREEAGVRESLGWATSVETPGVGRFQMFEGGEMIWIGQTDQTFAFSGDQVRVFDIPFTEESGSSP